MPRFGNVEWHDDVTSTFDVAEARARAGASHMTVIVARRQSAGRGRLGRTWESPDGGLWLTAILRPKTGIDNAFGLPALTIVLACALAEALELICGCEIRVRWPNDLYVGDRKVGGLLGELRWTGDQMDYCLLGIGVNVNVSSDTLSPDVRSRATSLATESGSPVALSTVLEAVLEAIAGTFERFEAHGASADIARVRVRCSTLGRRVQAALDDGSIVEGTAVDVGSLGSLVIETSIGPRELWTCREVRVIA